MRRQRRRRKKKKTRPRSTWPDGRRSYNMSIQYIILLHVHRKSSRPRLLYFFPCFNLHPRCHTIILAINIIVYLCVLLIPTRVERAQNLILFISLLSALVNSLFFIPHSLSLLVTHLSCVLRYAVFLSEI